MSLRDLDTIDIIVDSPHHDGFDLIVTDGGDVTDEAERRDLLVAKLKSYAGFVLSGQLDREHPGARERGVRMVVICATPPTDAMREVGSLRPVDGSGDTHEVVFLSKEEYVGK